MLKCFAPIGWLGDCCLPVLCLRDIRYTSCVNFLSFVCEDDFEFDTETLRLRCARRGVNALTRKLNPSVEQPSVLV